MRIVDVVEETTDASGNYTEVIVKFNAPYEALKVVMLTNLLLVYNKEYK
jgi:hypothetical protein